MTTPESFSRVTRLSDVSLMLNIACSSARIRRLTVERPESGPREVRPQLHLFISAEKSSLKSSMPMEAQSSYGGVYQFGLTFPALVGSIDKQTGMLTDSLAWEARDKVLFVDEFISTAGRKDELIKAFLPLLSDQVYSRSIGLKSVDKASQSRGNWFRLHKGRIELRVRFVAVFATMYSLKMGCRFKSHEALLDRCIPIEYKVTNDDRDAIAKGRTVFDHRPYKCPEEVTVGRKDFDRIYDLWKKHSGKVHDLRALDDCLRSFAVTQKHSDPLYRFIVDSHAELDAIKEDIERERMMRVERDQRRYYG